MFNLPFFSNIRFSSRSRNQYRMMVSVHGTTFTNPLNPRFGW